MRFLLLNALVPPGGVGGMLVSPPYSWEDVRHLVEGLRQRSDVVSAVGHPATAELLGVPCSRAEVTPEDGDVALVVRLKRRAASPGQDVQAEPEDLEFRLVRYGPALCDSSWCLLMRGYHPSSFE